MLCVSVTAVFIYTGFGCNVYLCVCALQVQRRVVGVRSGSSRRGGGGAGAVLAAVRAALFRRH